MGYNSLYKLLGGIVVYHAASKNDSYVRKALYEAYRHKCAYCGDLVQPKNMHVDHILATNPSLKRDADFDTYYSELLERGFNPDSLENYLPTCASCNLSKNNRNFNTANLRFFHQKALSHLDTVLKYYDSAKKQQVIFPSIQETNEFWEVVDFSYQRDISYAISQYRLGPADVCSCPRFEQVDEIKSRLHLLDYVTVQGEPGCGKSITIFQAAFDFNKNGWNVFRFSNNSGSSIEVANLPDVNKSLFIVDDAQNLPPHILESLFEQARPEKKIIFGKTESIEYSRDCIILTNPDSVRALKDHYSKLISEITPIIHAHDKQIGEKSFDYPLEYRIDDASKATTPWQFNYILCGGWKTMRSQYLSVSKFPRRGLLCAAIAAFQIAQLDKSVDFEWLKSFYAGIDNTIKWSEKDLKTLVEKKIVLSIDDVRIVHLRSANIVLAQFYKNSSEEDRTILKKAIEIAYKQKLFPILGLVWIVNGTSTYFDGIYHAERFLTEQTIDVLLNDFSVYKTASERMHVAYLLSVSSRVSHTKNELYYTRKNLGIIAEWISEACNANAYAYSVVVNDLINHDRALYEKLTSKVDWSMLVQSFSKNDTKGLYSWGNLINRLTYSVSDEDLQLFAKKIYTCCVENFNVIPLCDLPEFSYFLGRIYHLSPKMVSDLALSHIAEFKALWLKDTAKMVDIFDFDFLVYLCGESVLVKQKAKEDQKKVAKALVESLPVKEIAAFVSNSRSRHWHTIYRVFLLIKRYSKRKIAAICNLVDLEALNIMTEAFWEKTDDDLFFLCHSIGLGAPQKAEQFIRNNKSKIIHLRLPLIALSPKLAIELSKAGAHISLVENRWWDSTCEAVDMLINEDAEEANTIILSNDRAFAKEISSLCTLDLDDSSLLKTLKLIGDNNRSVLERIVNQIELTEFKDSVIKTLSDSRTTRTKVTRLHELIDYIALFSSNPQSLLELKKIRRKSSSSRNST